MINMMKRIAFIALVTSGMAGRTRAANEHEDHTRLLWEALPGEIREFLEPGREVFFANCHYPDHMRPFATEPREPHGFGEDWRTVLADDFDLLMQHGCNTPYALHQPRGKAVALMLIARAFRERQPLRAALWITSMAHGVCDQSAANHGPLWHIYLYSFRVFGIEVAPSRLLSSGPDGPVMPWLKKLKDDFPPRAPLDDPAEAMVDLMLTGLRSNVYMSRRDKAFAAVKAFGASEVDLDAEARAWAELLLFGARESLHAVVDVWSLVKAGKEFSFSPEIMARYQERLAAGLAARSLADDSIYDGLLEGVPGHRQVGVLLEPSQIFNATFFGFGAKHIQSILMRDMRTQATPYRALDIRDVAVQGLPDPSEMPVLVVCAGPFRVNDRAHRAFEAYEQAGGRFIWIASGRHREHYAGLMGPLSGALRAIEDEMFPAHPKRGGPVAPVGGRVGGAAVQFHDAFARDMGDAPYAFRRNPNTPGGWHKPLCTIRIDAPADGPVSTMVTFHRGERSYPVGAALIEEGGVRHLFLPQYLLFPFLLSEDSRIENLAEPTLDSFGQKVWRVALRLTFDEAERIASVAECDGTEKD